MSETYNTKNIYSKYVNKIWIRSIRYKYTFIQEN